MSSIRSGVHYFKRVLNMYTAYSGSTTSYATDGVMRFYQNSTHFTIDWTGATVGAMHFCSMSMFFALSAIPDYVRYTNYFEEYKISKVVVKLRPVIAAGQPSNYGSVAYGTPYLHYFIDHDDAVVPTPNIATVDQIRNRVNYKYARMDKPITIVIIPHISQSVYESSISTGYSSRRPMWLDNTNPAVQHYGLKMIAQHVPGATEGRFDFVATITYYLKTRSPIA